MEQEIIRKASQLEKLINNKRIFMVVTPSFKRLELFKVFQRDGVFLFDGFKPNPTIEQVENAIKNFKQDSFDLIVAAGGGSALDVAKCVKLFSNIDNGDYFNRELWNAIEIPLIAIPTTAGSGSEATRHAVIYRDGVKQSISTEEIIPNYVMLWNEALRTLPDYQKKSTMFDALCQAIESWWSNNSTAESIEFSKKSIRLIKANWEDYIANKESAFEPMLMASYYSGRAINITATTAAHAMSYGLTGRYKIPHGHAVALCMYRIWENMIKAKNKGKSETKNVDLYRILADINKVISFSEYERILTSTGLTDFEAERSLEDIKSLTKTVNPERLGNHPEKLDCNKLARIYSEVLGL